MLFHEYFIRMRQEELLAEAERARLIKKASGVKSKHFLSMPDPWPGLAVYFAI